MRPGINRVADNLVYIMPDFIHEFGYSAHHLSMIRTCDFDEDGSPISGTGPSNGSYAVHEFLDLWIFYPILHWLNKWIGDNKIYELLRLALGFFWGINCGFPLSDVALYIVWCFRGCAPLAVFEKKKEAWTKTYPDARAKEVLA